MCSGACLGHWSGRCCEVAPSTTKERIDDEERKRKEEHNLVHDVGLDVLVFPRIT